MGVYINIGNEGFVSARNSEYIDKSGLIAVINSTLNTERRFSCITRCRRFGKSLAAKTLCAYYDHSCDSRNLFADLEFGAEPRRKSDCPAILLELKKDLSANTAIGQIHRKEYQGKVLQYDGHAILVGISYDSKSKKHECHIQRYDNSAASV